MTFAGSTKKARTCIARPHSIHAVGVSRRAGTYLSYLGGVTHVSLQVVKRVLVLLQVCAGRVAAAAG
jgi:hypothetical protein